MQVQNMEHLLDLLNQGATKFFIALNGGARSSKEITLLPNKKFAIFNYIDDSEQEITQHELFDSSVTNIGAAINCGALYCDDPVLG